jgi:hypothetical protein
VAGTKISALPAVTTPAGTDEFPVVQAGTTKQETLTQAAQAGLDYAAKSITVLPSGPYVPIPNTLAAIGNVWFMAPPTGGDDTVVLQARAVALGAAGGGILQLAAGTYTVDIASGTTVGSGAVTINCCLYLPSNVWLRGAGEGVTFIQLKAVTRTPNVSGHAQCMIVNQHPDTTADHDIFVSDLTIDNNRQNQGPYAYVLSLAVVAQFVVDGLYFYGGTRMGADRFEAINVLNFGIFVENGASVLTFGQLRFRNCTAAMSIDAGTNITVNQVQHINVDAAYTINTTSATALSAGSSQTFVVASASGIAINSVLDLDIGTTNGETVLVTNVAGTSVTTYVANAHSGTWTVNDARFPTDASVQANLAALRCTFGLIDVDFSAALRGVSAGIEISGAKEVAIGTAVVRGATKGLWLHSWYINPTYFIPRDISIGSITIVNCVISSTGVFPVGLFIDDQAHSVSPSQTITDISIASATIHYGAGGAAIPGSAIGFQVSPNVKGLSVGEMVVDGGVYGAIVSGIQGAAFGATVIRNIQLQALLMANAASGNSFAALIVDNTGLQNAAQGQAIYFNNAATVISNNVFNGIVATNIPASSYVIDLQSSTGSGNSFQGNIANTGTATLVRDNALGNYYNLVGYTASNFPGDLILGVIGGAGTRLVSTQDLPPTVGSVGAGVTAQSVIAGGSNTSMQVQATLTAIAPGVVIGVVTFDDNPLATAPKAVVCSISAPTAGIAAPPIVGADTYTVNGFTLRSYGPTTVTTATYIITCHVFF